MIQWGLIKNNLKLMLRSKGILFLMIVMPLFSIGVLSSVFEEYLNSDLQTENIEILSNVLFMSANLDIEPANPIIIRQLPVDPIPSSIDYYGIIYVIYFAWCGIASLAMVIASERKNSIESRLQITPVSKFSLYLGKMIPCFLATAIEVIVTMILSILLFDVHWGRIWLSIGILLVMCFTVSAFSVFLIYVYNNIVLSIATAYVALMFLGLLGGTFTTYMYGFNESIARWSVIYHINRTLVELSTMGKSDYLGGSIIFMAGISLVSIFAGMFMMRKSMERKA